MIYCLVYKATAFMIKYQEFWNYSHGLKKIDIESYHYTLSSKCLHKKMDK